MKVYSDKLSRSDLVGAVNRARARGADVFISDMREWQARSAMIGLEVHLASENGRRATNRGNRDGYYGDPERAASWDAWGWVIAELYKRDPAARIGQYRNAGDFVLQVLHAKAAGRKEPDDFLQLVTESWSWAKPKHGVDLSRELAELDERIADIDRSDCTFWACDGPGQREIIGMKTCNVHASAIELRKLRDKIARKVS